MIGRSILGLVLLVVASTGCTESGMPLDSSGVPPSSDGPGSTDVGANGPHAGTIWIPRIDETEVFNLQTGARRKISDGRAIPSKDGSVYLEVVPAGRIRDDFCSFTQYEDGWAVNVKSTRTGEVFSSFVVPIGIASREMRLSPDGQRMAMYVARDEMDCGGNFDYFFTVFSKDGTKLNQQTITRLQSYDWHPDGRLVVLRARPDDIERGYVVQIETLPGSFEFQDVFTFVADPDVLGFRSLRIGPTGTDAVVEAVTGNDVPLSGVRYRNSAAHHFPLVFENEGSVLPETELFELADSATWERINGPTFSPDGKHILVTEGYVSGAALFQQYYPPLDQVDSLLVVPLHGNNTSYIVPTDVKQQPMPPEQYSENIRPVVSNNEYDNPSITGFYPLLDISWTPVID